MPQKGTLWGTLQEARWRSRFQTIYLGEQELRDPSKPRQSYKPSMAIGRSNSRQRYAF
jgi:hypothetical protein